MAFRPAPRLRFAGATKLISPSGAYTAARAVIKRAYHAAQRVPDRVMHRRRHRAALEVLSRMPHPRTIMVLCHGNICRSPYLQALLHRALPDMVVESAGFVGPDRPVPELSLRVSARRGIDLSRFRSQGITPQVVRNADLVVVMEVEQARHLTRELGVPANRIIIAGDLDPLSGESRMIRDPWQQSIDVFESSFDRLERCSRTIETAMRRRATS